MSDGSLYGTYDDSLYGSPWGMFDDFPDDVSTKTYKLMKRAVKAETQTAKNEQEELSLNDDTDVYFEIYLQDRNEFFELCDTRFGGNIDSLEAYIRDRYEAWYKVSRRTYIKAYMCRHLLARAHESMVEDLRRYLEEHQDESPEMIAGMQSDVQRGETMYEAAKNEAAEHKNKTDTKIANLNESRERCLSLITNFCAECRSIRANQ